MTKKELWENYFVYEKERCDECNGWNDSFFKISYYNQFAKKEMIRRICKSCFKYEKW